MLDVQRLIYMYGLIVVPRIVITMVGSPNVSSYTLNILGVHTFICLDTNFALFLNKARMFVDSMESLSM